jgi:O-antigen/teichoic acid export membrane protein
VVTTIGLAVTRGLGGVGPFVLIGQVAVPGLRPVVILAVAVLGGSAVAAGVSWAAVLGLAAIPVVTVVRHQLRSLERLTDGLAVPPDRQTLVRAGRFTLPRVFSSTIELAQQWFDVVLVGILAGPAAAGVYGAATRFVNAGLIPFTSMRIVVAPQFSAALHRDDRGLAQTVYRRTSTWIVTLSVPVYAVLALFGGTVLSLVGPGFTDGAPMFAIMAVGAVVYACAGNAQSVLLMSGRSGWVVVDKAVVLTVLIAGLLLAVPSHGVVGAAVAWAVAWAVDGLVAAFQISRLVGVRPEARRLFLALAVAGLPFLVAGGAARAWLGDSVTGLAVGGGVGLAFYGAAVWAARRPLELDGLQGLLRRRTTVAVDEEE